MIDLSMDEEIITPSETANRRKAAAPILTPEIRAQFNKEMKVIEEAAFEKGRASVQNERAIPADGTAAKLAKRAAELQAAALAKGEKLSNADSVLAAYREAGIPLE